MHVAPYRRAKIRRGSRALINHEFRIFPAARFRLFFFSFLSFFFFANASSSLPIFVSMLHVQFGADSLHNDTIIGVSKHPNLAQIGQNFAYKLAYTHFFKKFQYYRQSQIPSSSFVQLLVRYWIASFLSPTNLVSRKQRLHLYPLLSSSKITRASQEKSKASNTSWVIQRGRVDSSFAAKVLRVLAAERETS